jgi:spore germination protein
MGIRCINLLDQAETIVSLAGKKGGFTLMLYQRLSMVMFPIVTVAFIGTAVWGYLEHQDKNSILIKAENQYQRAFHDLSFHMDKLHSELGHTLAVNSTSQSAYRKGLVNVWRLTSEAQSDINQLPLSLLPFNKTEEFLANLANFSYRTSVRDLSKEPLQDGEMKTLSALFDHSKELTAELRGVQDKVITQNLRWMDVEVSLASQREPSDSVIIDGFSSVDKKVSAYPEINWGPGSMAGMHTTNVRALSGNMLSAADIKKKAAQFLNLSDVSALQVFENGSGGTNYQSYSVTLPSGNNGGNGIQMDFTKKGGQLVYYMNPRAVTKTILDIRQARDVANEFLDQHGYTDMSAVSYDQYDHSANIVFAKRQNGITLYPEQIDVNVALDDGEITGIQATDYVFSQKEHKLGTPKVSGEEARKTLSPKLDVSSQSLAVIKNDLEQEVLCYEFIGKMNGEGYRIYVNGDTGDDEKIETITMQETSVIGK